MINVVNLAVFLESKLNANSQNLVFRTYTFEKTLDKRYEYVQGTGKINFVPSIISSPMGSYLPMNDVRGVRVGFNLEIMLPLADKLDWINMLNDFVYSINGKVFYYKSDGTFVDTIPLSGSYETIKMTCQIPTFSSVSPANFELVKEIGSYLPINKTEDYVGINVPIQMKTINGFIIGDQAKISLANIPAGTWVASNSTIWATYTDATRKLVISGSTQFFTSSANLASYMATNYLNSSQYVMASGVSSGGTTYYVFNQASPEQATFVKLKTTDFTIKNTKVPITEHWVGETTGQSWINQNDVKYITTTYYEKNTLLDAILGDIVMGTNMNKNYFIKMELPNGVFYQRVIIFDNSGVFPIDEFSLIPLVFAKAL